MVNDNDDLSKTMVIPNPGGRREPAPQPAGVHNQPADLDRTQLHPHAGSNFQHTSEVRSTPIQGENPLLAQARDIINLAANIRTLTPGTTVGQLRMDVERLFNEFGDNLSRQPISNEVALTARYLLCCLVDEMVLSTPWGTDGLWSQQTLLSKYHNESSGGQKFFLIVDRILQNPATNIDLIELCYVCISLGFRGQYRITQTGENEVLQILNRLYQPIALYRPEANELSPSWQPADSNPSPLQRRFPASLLLTGILLVCVAVYVYFVSSLNTRSAPVLSQLETIAWDDIVASTRTANPSSASSTSALRQLETALAQSINTGQIQVLQTDGLLTIRLISPALFPPGSTEVNPTALPAVQTLANTILAHTTGVIIVGHTDSTGKAQSNWAISRQRAEAIQRWLATANPTIQQSMTQGLADTQPLVDDSSASLNRRVEIILLPKDAS